MRVILTLVYLNRDKNRWNAWTVRVTIRKETTQGMIY